MSDDLDTLIRKAASAHLALAPSSVLTTPGVDEDHDLIARALRRMDDPAYLAKLEPFDPEAVMMSDPDHDDDRDRPRAAPPTSATDDSGLHDIRALAQNAKQRISRKMPTVTESDDSLLASTTGQLKAIALPEPARLVMLPDLPASADADLARATAQKIESRGAALSAPSTATASDVTSLESARPRKRTALWLGLGGAAAAAAVIAVVASGGGGAKKPAASESVAAAPTPPPPPTIEAAAPGGAGRAVAATGAMADPSAETAPAAPTPPATEDPEAKVAAASPTADDRREREREQAARGAADEPKPTRPAAAGPAAGSAGAGAGSAREVKAPPDKPTADKAADVKGPKGAAGAGGPPAGGGAATGGSGEKSIDDLLGDVGTKPPSGGGGGGAPKPEKKGLDGKDIKAGMSPLAGKAQGCFDQHGVAGHVKIKAIVDPSGKVTKVDAVGEFAGTPTGQCVAGVVKSGASFPAWDGAPMTVNYSYTLNE